MADKTDYRIETQQTLIALVTALSRSWPEHQPIATLAQETGLSRDQVFRTLANLELGGWAEQSPAGWILSPALTLISERMRLAIGALHRRYLIP